MISENSFSVGSAGTGIETPPTIPLRINQAIPLPPNPLRECFENGWVNL
jgi:hypothetical protein